MNTDGADARDRGQALARAAAYIEVNRLDDARAALREELTGNPDSWQALCMMAVIEHRSDRPAMMLRSAESACATAPGQEWPHRLRAIALLRTDRTTKAIEAARRAVQIAPRNYATHLTLADCLLSRDTLESRLEAHDCAELVLRLAPLRADAHLLTGRVRESMGDTRGANRAYRQALALDPQNINAVHSLGVNHLNSGRVRSGAQKIRGAAAADPLNERLRVNTQHADGCGCGGRWTGSG